MTLIPRALVLVLLLAAGACSSRPGSSPSPTGAGTAIVLRTGDRVATATLADTPAARDLLAMLPVSVPMRDAWAQAKSGRLPRDLAVDRAEPVHDPAPAEIYFVPGADVIAVYYADLGQRVPGSGLVRLGVVEDGLDNLAEAGRRFTVRIERAEA
ncbi:cyclophilin-like fold protein [Paractinoplanes lichenicola]|uniref:Cyclophilin-like domain-containing protein n=1 Tax=Paractinoplanes lichenicola TaxID=2802976 RepID=A0ABS1VM96_9ACTN|nr:cyclophilin-like fold protein [Actinoplanes lichenicola]MBL7255851.1 hypothetical protein [Actinoplanes lichenicola]